MKFRRFALMALGCVSLTVVAPTTASAFSLTDLLPTGVADIVPSGSAGLFAPPAPPPPPAPPAPAPAPQAPAPPPAPRPAPSIGYKNCTEAWEAGVAPLYRGESGYAPKLDRDDDGVACERDPR
ncbi:MAG: excalibur calcium-binding domain-containing protein [Rhodococcus sp. (in: high G+C Gram-positive bacteria)]|uniref:excalibur calcium-binding domain-containing protein n=1 Tax=Rhodococcus sp. TaxID=1831 RepID=UPI003BB79203